MRGTERRGLSTVSVTQGIGVLSVRLFGVCARRVCGLLAGQTVGAAMACNKTITWTSICDRGGCSVCQAPVSHPSDRDPEKCARPGGDEEEAWRETYLGRGELGASGCSFLFGVAGPLLCDGLWDPSRIVSATGNSRDSINYSTAQQMIGRGHFSDDSTNPIRHNQMLA